MKRDTQRSPALICASFAARAAAGEAANGSLHELGMDCLYGVTRHSDPIHGRETLSCRVNRRASRDRKPISPATDLLVGRHVLESRF